MELRSFTRVFTGALHEAPFYRPGADDAHRGTLTALLERMETAVSQQINASSDAPALLIWECKECHQLVGDDNTVAYHLIGGVLYGWCEVCFLERNSKAEAAHLAA
jgi:hypothetical protein